MGSSTPKPVLIVDDDDAIRDALAELLREEGYSVVEASDGQEALQKLQHILLPCVVVLDLMMPRMSGDELVRHLRRDHPEILARLTLVIATASRQLPQGLDAHVVLRKPFELERLLEIVAQQCA